MIRIKKDIKFDYLVYIFFTISIFAWFLEILYSLVFRFKLVNPGSLTGPWCPVYGVTSLLLVLIIYKDNHKLLNFIKIYLIATLTEYFASFVCDKLFHRTIWDYSEFFLNINGRICLIMSLVFTLMSFIMIYYVEPLLQKKYNKNENIIHKINIILIILFIIDLVIKIITKNFY